MAFLKLQIRLYQLKNNLKQMKEISYVILTFVQNDFDCIN